MYAQHAQAKVHALATTTPRVRARTFKQVRRVAANGETPDVKDVAGAFETEMEAKKRRSDELRAQEKWMKVGTGEADCISCGYKYDPKQGDPEYPISPGTKFQDLPEDWNCPICGAAPKTFQVQEQEIAGFAVNQGYGFGTNSMTEGQKSGLIYGSLGIFFALFLCGYFLQQGGMHAWLPRAFWCLRDKARLRKASAVASPLRSAKARCAKYQVHGEFCLSRLATFCEETVLQSLLVHRQLIGATMSNGWHGKGVLLQ
eukprot:TRINITY_DN18693_c0_g1_i3.p1 TRINITY_DN18693_c0_g1~~TRINITY_DN18693_c0_g1_i3.p1  ORF type:complete len:258 (-),score=16.73 TRINITY_DN18693_c0_g1_i3:124-897(-)